MSEQVLISPEYAEQNRILHESRKDYGIIGARWVKNAAEICQENGWTIVLDYGCGKGSFKKTSPSWMTVHEYDPAIKGKETPHKAELVVCTDVLEHIEPECLDSVLEHIREMGHSALLIISLTSSNKKLPDGRNAHLIVQPKEWWMDKIFECFDHIDVLPKRKIDELVVQVW